MHSTLFTCLRLVRPIYIASLLSIWWALASPALAMSLSPLETQLTPAGRGSSAVFRLNNTGADPIAVDFSIKKRLMDNDGTDILSDAENDFTIVPSQVSLQAGQVQSIRIQYVGEPVVGQELAYRLIAEQLPLDNTKALKSAPSTSVGVRLLLKYIASVYVTPARAKPQLELIQLSVSNKPEKPNPQLEVTLKNTGQAHVILTKSQLQFKYADKSYSLSAGQLSGLENENLLADTQRTFIVNWADAPQPSPQVSQPVKPQEARFTQQQ